MFSKLQPHLEILNSLQLHLNAKVLALLSDRGVLNRQGQLDLVCGHVSGRLQLPNSSQHLTTQAFGILQAKTLHDMT